MGFFWTSIGSREAKRIVNFCSFFHHLGEIESFSRSYAKMVKMSCVHDNLNKLF